MLTKIGILQTVSWAVLASILGLSLGQALAIGIAGNIWFWIGVYVGGQNLSHKVMQYIDQHL